MLPVVAREYPVASSVVHFWNALVLQHLIQFQVPPLTPCTNKMVGETLRLTYSTWVDQARLENIPEDPRLWRTEDVASWLRWSIEEFSLDLEADVCRKLIEDFEVSQREIGAIMGIDLRGREKERDSGRNGRDCV